MAQETVVEPVEEALGLPPHGRRFAAFAIDSVVFAVAIALTVALDPLLHLSGGWTVGLLLLLVLILGATNGFTTWLSGGATIGKAWAGLQVRHLHERPIDPSPGELPKVIVRHTLGYLGIDVLLIGCLNALRDPRRRPLHDFVLGYEVVALPQAPASTKERLRAFKEDWEAGERLIREEWGLAGAVAAKYAGTVSLVSGWFLWLLEKLGLSAASAHSSSTGSMSVLPATTPTTAVGGALTVGGSVVSAAAIAAAGTTLGPGAAAYPDELTLVPAVQYEEEAYPMGLPPDLRLEFTKQRPATVEELEDLAVVTAAERSTATLTFTDGEFEGRSFRFDDVMVPTAWRTDDLGDTETKNWSNLSFSTDGSDFVPEGMVVADIRRVEGTTYAGYKVASDGELTISFPYRGDGQGEIDELGVVVTWEGDMECVVVDDNPAEGFDPRENCDDKSDDMFWVWGVNSITWG